MYQRSLKELFRIVEITIFSQRAFAIRCIFSTILFKKKDKFIVC